MSVQTASRPTRPVVAPALLERRAAVRLPCNLNTFCQVAAPGEGRPSSAWVCDVSVAGVGLFTERRFETGTVLTLELSNPKRRLTLRVQARVVHSDVQLPNDAWLHGAAFCKPLSERELQALLP